MAQTVLIDGNEAIARGAICAGCRAFFGYPITPQSEVGEYMSRELPKVGGVFVQSESESAAIYMLFGGVLAGERTMTSTSSPGFSLMQEGISWMAEDEPTFPISTRNAAILTPDRSWYRGYIHVTWLSSSLGASLAPRGIQAVRGSTQNPRPRASSEPLNLVRANTSPRITSPPSLSWRTA